MLIRPPTSTTSQLYEPNENKSNPYAKICLNCPRPDKPCKKGICNHYKREYRRLKEEEEKRNAAGAQEV